MKRKSILIFFIELAICSSLYPQVTFHTIQGSKANYSISIPNNYSPKKSISGNIDIKYVDSKGASIITVIKDLPESLEESDIQQMSIATDKEYEDQLESTGLENISIIKRGFKTINGVKSYFAYYRSTELYFHTITQFRKGKLINLTCTCEYSKMDLYMPNIFRVVNSLKS